MAKRTEQLGPISADEFEPMPEDPAHDVTVLSESDELDAGAVLPGFRVSLTELFDS